jgi:hypothetical protein
MSIEEKISRLSQVMVLGEFLHELVLERKPGVRALHAWITPVSASGFDGS